MILTEMPCCAQRYVLSCNSFLEAVRLRPTREPPKNRVDRFLTEVKPWRETLQKSTGRRLWIRPMEASVVKEIRTPGNRVSGSLRFDEGQSEHRCTVRDYEDYYVLRSQWVNRVIWR